MLSVCSWLPPDLYMCFVFRQKGLSSLLQCAQVAFAFFLPLSPPPPQVKQTIPPFYKQSVGLNSPYLRFGRGCGRTS